MSPVAYDEDKNTPLPTLRFFSEAKGGSESGDESLRPIHADGRCLGVARSCIGRSRNPLREPTVKLTVMWRGWPRRPNRLLCALIVHRLVGLRRSLVSEYEV
jgi:hypothetical protein